MGSKPYEKMANIEVLDYIEELGYKEAAKQNHAANSRMAQTLGKNKVFVDSLEKALSRVFSENPVVVNKRVYRKHSKPKRILHIDISDTHFQSLLNGKTTAVRYMPEQEARSLAAIALQVVEYKTRYRDDTELYVHLQGDILAGKIHDKQATGPMAHQTASAIHLLVQFISFVSAEFRKVTVFTNPGNHGRDPTRHEDRAMSDKWDAIENTVYYSIKVACRTLTNVKVHIPYTPYYIFPCFDELGFGTHGDTVINFGNPGKSINTGLIEKQVNKWNAKPEYAAKKCSLFVAGHVHSPACFVLQNGVWVITNGALLPSDGYGENSGYFETATGQWMWESTPQYIVGDNRYINVKKKDRENKALEDIIKPFYSFED